MPHLYFSYYLINILAILTFSFFFFSLFFTHLTKLYHINS